MANDTAFCNFGSADFAVDLASPPPPPLPFLLLRRQAVLSWLMRVPVSQAQ